MKLDEVVTLGRHRLMCGDSGNPEHVARLFGDVRPDLVFIWSSAEPSCSAVGMTDIIEEAKIGTLYREGWTAQEIAGAVGMTRWGVMRRLSEQRVPLRKRGELKRPVSEETRAKMREAKKGYQPWLKGRRMADASRRRCMQGQLGHGIDLSDSRYPDYERLRILTPYFYRDRLALPTNDDSRQRFLDHFYHDPGFNAVYDLWVATNKSKWTRPSIDHIHPRSNGQPDNLRNLRFITWFENRAKAEMTQPQWMAFRERTGTVSDLFIESILAAKEASICVAET